MPETTQFGGAEEETGIDGALQTNTILLARYRVLGMLGGGGQGAVYQARDLNFPEAKRLVAVKEMHVTAADANLRASTLKTFQREANILATLTHPAIPNIYDFFEQNDRAYLVMEYINGRDLEAILQKTSTLPIDKIIEWAIDLCDVLQYLHDHQPEPIIFRDMKPANIMIDSLGKVRLIDFGIAKVFVKDVKNTMIGTEGYSAPEQYKGDVNPLSDIYSLGATLHQVITRKDPRLEPPFSFSERALKDFNEGATPGLQAVIDKALQFESENRYQSCAEMKADLEALRYGQKAAIIPEIDPDDPDKKTTFFDDIGVELLWKFKTEDELRSSPSAYGGMVYVGSYDTNVWAFDLESGEFVWKRPTEGGIASSPIVDRDNKLILFGSEDTTYLAVDYQNGRVNWSYLTSGKIRGTGRIAHGHVFFGSDDGKLYALVAGNGRFLWDYDMGAPIRSRPAVTNDRIIVGNDDGDIVGLELNGQRKWGYRARRGVSSGPFVDIENVCYVGSFDNYLYAIDASNGYSMWKYRTNGAVVSSPVVEGTTVYFGSADGTLYAVNTQTGKERWRFQTEKPIVASPAYHDGAIYIGGTDGILYCINAKDGKDVWKYKTDGPITCTPCITESSIIFGSMDHTLYALPLVSIQS